jgi:ABC-type Fe3+/spermidine/putrescine transport system ATPase subunit
MSADLAIEAVCVACGATPVLNKLSLEVQRGEMVALLGNSGCGKTPLLRAIAGLMLLVERFFKVGVLAMVTRQRPVRRQR